MMLLRVIVIFTCIVLGGLLGAVFPGEIYKTLSVLVGFLGVIAASSLAVFAVLASKEKNVVERDAEMGRRIKTSILHEKVSLALQQSIIFQTLVLSVLLCLLGLGFVKTDNGFSIYEVILMSLCGMTSSASFMFAFYIPVLLMRLVKYS